MWDILRIDGIKQEKINFKCDIKQESQKKISTPTLPPDLTGPMCASERKRNDEINELNALTIQSGCSNEFFDYPIGGYHLLPSRMTIYAWKVDAK